MPRETVAAGPIAVASGLAPIGTTIRTPLGAPFSGDVGSFRDDRTGATGDRTKFTAKVDWGDGTAPTPAEVEGAGGTTFRLVSGHSYAQAGYYTVRTTVTSTDGAATTVVETSLIVTGDPKPSFTTNGRPCANMAVTFTSTTAASPGAEIVNHTWKIDDSSAFGQPNGGKPFDTGSNPSLTYTFGYTSVEMGLGTDDMPPPTLPLRLHRNPVTVTLTTTDATNVVRSVTQSIRFLDDGYKPTDAAPTPKGCGTTLFGEMVTSASKLASVLKVSKAGAFKFGAGCPTVLDCLARVDILSLPGGGPRVAATKPLTLGGGAAFVRKGTNGSVSVALNARGRALVKARGRLRAQLVITSLAGGARKTTKRTITLAR
jgi:hypothetical protein